MPDKVGNVHPSMRVLNVPRCGFCSGALSLEIASSTQWNASMTQWSTPMQLYKMNFTCMPCQLTLPLQEHGDAFTVYIQTSQDTVISLDRGVIVRYHALVRRIQARQWTTSLKQAIVDILPNGTWLWLEGAYLDTDEQLIQVRAGHQGELYTASAGKRHIAYRTQESNASPAEHLAELELVLLLEYGIRYDRGWMPGLVEGGLLDLRQFRYTP